MYFFDPDSKLSAQTEKPYELTFEPPAGFPRQNFILTKHENIQINDIRGVEADFSIFRNGFEIMQHKTCMLPDDFYSPEKVEDEYLKNLGLKVKSALGAYRVQIFDYKVLMISSLYSLLELKLNRSDKVMLHIRSQLATSTSTLLPPRFYTLVGVVNPIPKKTFANVL